MKKTAAIFFLLFLGCQNESRREIYPPREFVPEHNVYLGQTFWELNRTRTIKRDEYAEDEEYLEYLSRHPYFTEVRYIFDGGFFGAISGSNRLVRVVFTKGTSASTLQTDSLARKVVRICRNNYGETFNIFHGSYQGDVVSVALHWQLAKEAQVKTRYIPFFRAEELRKESKRGWEYWGRLQVEFLYGEKSDTAVAESSVFTRENLGLSK